MSKSRCVNAKATSFVDQAASTLVLVLEARQTGEKLDDPWTGAQFTKDLAVISG